MREQHLSDEAIAAFADDVLTGHARERARRHTASCAECNYAVAVQREAVWALRSAPAPSLPSGLLDRLRDVPANTPIQGIPTFIDEDGTAMFATFAAPAAAFVPHTPKPRSRHSWPFAMTAASVAVVGALAGSAAAADNAATPSDSGYAHPAHPASVHFPVRGTTELPVDVQLVRAFAPVPAR